MKIGTVTYGASNGRAPGGSVAESVRQRTDSAPAREHRIPMGHAARPPAPSHPFPARITENLFNLDTTVYSWPSARK